MKDKKSIYKDGEQTIVCFGRGRICISHTEDDEGQQLIWFGDTKKDREIGRCTGDVGDWTWENDIEGETVLLGFDNVKSIELVEEVLKKAKENLKAKE